MTYYVWGVNSLVMWIVGTKYTTRHTCFLFDRIPGGPPIKCWEYWGERSPLVDRVKVCLLRQVHDRTINSKGSV